MSTFDQFMDKVMKPLDPILLEDPENLSEWQRLMVQVMQDAIVHGKSFYIVRPREHGKSIAQTVLDLQRELKEPKPLPKREEDGFVPFADWIKSQEPVKKTKPLPYYHGKRRF